MNPEAQASTPKRRKKTNAGPYQEAYAAQAYKLCLLGAIDRDLGSFFEVTRETIVHWKAEHDEFALAITRGNRAADMEVAESLYRSTLDKVVTVKQAIKCKEVYYDENGKRVEKERIEIVEVEKHVPADFRSQQFWLRNRNPKLWSLKHEEPDEYPVRGLTINLGPGHNPEVHETAG
jgi:hypothetical protein